MSDIIHRLKQEHKDLAAALLDVTGMREACAKEALLSLHERLLEHFRTEDEELYPYIEEAARTNHLLRITLARFSAINDIMPGIKKLLSGFAARTGPAQGEDAHGLLIKLLVMRFKREEEVLFVRFIHHNRLLLAG